MKLIFCIILFTSFVIAEQTSAFAQSDSFMCSGGIVSQRDIASDVVRKCGQPAYTTQREQAVVEEGDSPSQRIVRTIIIDDWIFNFGPNRFQYRVILKNGMVWSVESLGYGY
jgi:hypothetical protein